MFHTQTSAGQRREGHVSCCSYRRARFYKQRNHTSLTDQRRLAYLKNEFQFGLTALTRRIRADCFDLVDIVGGLCSLAEDLIEFCGLNRDSFHRSGTCRFLGRRCR